MRLAGLTLERYGPFEELHLPLDPMPGRVNLVIAPNGYGKSVIRGAIGDLLFGIPERTPMDFRFGTEKMRLRADIAAAGTATAVVRRKGRGNTLADADGNAMPPETWQATLGEADAKLFRELFGLDTALLRQGGQDLIGSQGRLGRVLFAAGGGMGRVRDLLARLERQRDEIGRAETRHKSRPLWSALSAWERAGTDFSRAALRPEGWLKFEAAAEAATASLTALLAEQASLAAEQEGLRLTGSIRPWLVQLSSAQAILAEADDAPELDTTFEENWRSALAAGALTASRVETAEATEAQLLVARAQLHFDPAWLDAEAEIEALNVVRARAEFAEADLPAVSATLAEERARCVRLRRDLGLAPEADLLPAPLVHDAQRRLRAYPALAAAAEIARQARDDAAGAMSRLRDAFAALSEAADPAPLADLAAALRAGGDPVARIAAAGQRLRQAERALAAALAAIPDRALPEAALAQTAAPSDPALDAADRRLTRAEAAHQRAVEDRLACETAIAAAGDELALLVRSAQLPAPDALAEARATRDRLWQTLLAAPPDPAAHVAVDRAMRSADDVADALIAHGQEMAQADALRRRLSELERTLAACVAKTGSAAADLAASRGTLAALATAAGAGTPPDIASLRAFLRARATAVTRAAERDAAAQEAADMTAQLGVLGRRLAQALDVPEPPPEALGPLLAEADRRIAARRSDAERRAALTRQLAEQQARLAPLTSAARMAEEKLAQWQQGWRDLSPALARPQGEPMEATAEALPLIEKLRSDEAARDATAQRVTDMQAALSLLAEKITLATRLWPDHPSATPIEAALALDQRLRTERLQAARCRDADTALLAAAATLAEARRRASAARETLIGLRAALRADTDDAAERRLHLARTAKAARRDIAQATQELTRQGGGIPVAGLAERAAATTPEADTLRMRAIVERQEVLAAQIEAARDRRTSSLADRDQAAHGNDAAEAAARREGAQATLSRLAEEALVLHAAHALLQAALDRQADGASQPLLIRIGALFRQITGGAYAGVAVEDGRAGQTMVTLEADGLTRKPLDQLSEGTGDQLYLAMRIAALEDYAAKTSPLPFIVDDVLQTFDDLRTVATLQALVELSAQVQVIALTHHPHVGALATGLPVNVVTM